MLEVQKSKIRTGNEDEWVWNEEKKISVCYKINLEMCLEMCLLLM